MRAASTDGLSAGVAGALRPDAAPLFHAAWLFAVGVVVARFFWIPPSWLLVALALTALLCAACALRAQRLLWSVLALLWMLLGCWCARMEPQPQRDAQVAAFSDGLLRTLEGTVVQVGPLRTAPEESLDESQEGVLPPSAPTQTVDLQLSSMEYVDDLRDEPVAAQGRLRLTVRWPRNGVAPQAFGCGQKLAIAARLLPPQSYRVPGVFRLQDYQLNQGISAAASVPVGQIQSLGSTTEQLLLCKLAEVQHQASQRLLTLPAAMRAWPLPSALKLSHDDALILATMLTGDKALMTPDIKIDFVRTGSFHILVVSGSHLAIVAALVFWLARRLRMAQWLATLATLAATAAYALFTGFELPVQRSLWMIAVYLLGRLIYRERSALNSIGFSVLVLLMLSPEALFEASFQMTLLAVLAIGGFAAPLLADTVEPRLRATTDLGLRALDMKLEPKVAAFRVQLRLLADALRRCCRTPRAQRLAGASVPALVRWTLRGFELVALSCAVELAMTLPMAQYFHRIPLSSLPVNLLFLPLLTVLMPAALVTMLLLYIVPALAVLPAAMVAGVLHLATGLVHGFGSLSWSDFRMPAPLLGQQFAFCLLLALAVALACMRTRLRRLSWLALLLAALCVAAPSKPAHPADALLAEAIDVGQGDSMLLMTPDGKSLLVDGGGYTGGPRAVTNEFDIGEEVVSPALWARGLRHLDVVVLSHAHSDHMGGLPAVLRNFRPAELWVGDNPPSEAYDALLQLARELHVRVRALHAGDEFALGAAQVRVLAPLTGYRPGRAAANNDSLVLHVACGAASVQLEGDAEAPVERGVMEAGNLASTLLKVGHHGSVNATTPEFLAQVQPKMAVISAGRNNRFGHPRPEVLEELQAAGVKTYRTDLSGALCFELGVDGSRRAYACSR